MSAVSPAPSSAVPPRARAGALPGWWPLAAITLLGAVLRLSTLDLQSFWYDEAFTPVHVLHASLSATLHGVVHTENSPPLWYLIAWADSRLFGTGEVALRLPSALAGIASIPVAWGIGRELAGRRAAILCAALIAVGPLFVWYSQEARAYGLIVLTQGLVLLAFLRAQRSPGGGRMAAFAAAGALALVTHYFAVFLIAPLCVLLLADARTRRACLPAIAVLVLVGAALLPLISAQGGHGTQWIGRWPLSERLQAIPQYYLTGPSGEPLGHGVELLVALPLALAALLGLIGMVSPPRRAAETAAGGGEPPLAERRRGAAQMAIVAGAAVLVPLVLALGGADYLAPRNLLGAMVPVSALLAVLATAPEGGRWAPALAAVGVAALLAITIDVDLSPRLQRGDWRGLAAKLRAGGEAGAIGTVELGSAPLQYYLPGLRPLTTGTRVLVSAADETGYSPLRASAGESPSPALAPAGRLDVNGMIAYRFRGSAPAWVTETALRRRVPTLAHPEVLVAAGTPVSR